MDEFAFLPERDPGIYFLKITTNNLALPTATQPKKPLQIDKKKKKQPNEKNWIEEL